MKAEAGGGTSEVGYTLVTIQAETPQETAQLRRYIACAVKRFPAPRPNFILSRSYVTLTFKNPVRPNEVLRLLKDALAACERQN